MRLGENKLQKHPPCTVLSGVSALYRVLGEPGTANRLVKMHAGLLQDPYFLAQIFCRGIAQGFPCVDPNAAKHLLQTTRLLTLLWSPKSVISS